MEAPLSVDIMTYACFGGSEREIEHSLSLHFPGSYLPRRLRGLEVVPASTFARTSTTLGRVGGLHRTPDNLQSILDGRHHDFHVYFPPFLPIILNYFLGRKSVMDFHLTLLTKRAISRNGTWGLVVKGLI